MSRRGLFAQMLRSTEQGHHRVIKSSGRGVLSEAGVNFDAKIIQETSSAKPPPSLHIELVALGRLPESDERLADDVGVTSPIVKAANPVLTQFRFLSLLML